DAARRQRYKDDLAGVQAAWDEGKLDRVPALLEAQKPRPGQADLRGFEWYYWNKQLHRQRHASEKPALTLKYADSVRCVAFSPDGKLLACSPGKSVKLYDAVTGQELRTLEGHAAVVRTVAFSPDGKRLASASRDGTVRVWEPATGRHIFTMNADEGQQ